MLFSARHATTRPPGRLIRRSQLVSRASDLRLIQEFPLTAIAPRGVPSAKSEAPRLSG